MKKLRVTVEGKVYEVLVEMLDEPERTAAPPIDRPITSAPLVAPTLSASAAPKPAAAGAGDVTSPLAGRIVSVDVQVGQSVAAGAQLATIEAMKMNTYIYAPSDSTVKELIAKPGDAVEEGAIILRLG